MNEEDIATPEEEIEAQIDSSVITLSSILQSCIELSETSAKAFQFFEDTSNRNACNDRYVLLSADGKLARFFIRGTITALDISAARAISHRRPFAKVDEYTVIVRIEEESALRKIKSGFDIMLKQLEKNPHAMENIALAGGLIDEKGSRSLRGIERKVSGLSGDIIYFNRKVAEKSLYQSSERIAAEVLDLYPKQGSKYPQLLKPPGWKLSPLIPLLGNDYSSVSLETVQLPAQGTIYFEVMQMCYNFTGTDNKTVRQISLLPRIMAVTVEPAEFQEPNIAQAAKRMRFSF